MTTAATHRSAGIAPLVAIGAFGLGVGLAALGRRVGPIAVVALPIVLIVAGASLSVPRRAVALTVLAMPLGIIQIPGVPLQVIDAAILAGVGLVVVARGARGHAPLAWSGALGWALALVALAVLATPSAVDVGLAVRSTAQLLSGVLLAFAVISVCETEQDLRWLVAVFLGVATVICLIAFPSAGQLRASFGGAVVENRATSVFAQPNELGSYSGMVLLTAVGAFLSARTRRGRNLTLVTVLAALGALGLSLSRGAWVGTALGVVGLAVLLPSARRLLALGVPALAIAVVAAALSPSATSVRIVQARLGSITEQTVNPYDERPIIYAEGRRQVIAEPWNGVGPGNFPAASARSVSDAQTVGADHAHNALLTVAAEIGLPAAGVLAGLTLALAFAALKTVSRLRAAGRERAAALAGGLGAALLSVAGHGLVDFPLRNPVLFATVWILSALLLAAARTLPSHEPGLP